MRPSPGAISSGWRVYGLPVVMKGILTAEDAVVACRARSGGDRRVEPWRAATRRRPGLAGRPGGGRPRPSDGRAEVLLDGGVRRGTDVLKALALGARGVDDRPADTVGPRRCRGGRGNRRAAHVPGRRSSSAWPCSAARRRPASVGHMCSERRRGRQARHAISPPHTDARDPSAAIASARDAVLDSTYRGGGVPWLLGWIRRDAQRRDSGNGLFVRGKRCLGNPPPAVRAIVGDACAWIEQGGPRLQRQRRRRDADLYVYDEPAGAIDPARALCRR